MKKIYLLISLIILSFNLSAQQYYEVRAHGWGQQQSKINFKDSINIDKGWMIDGVVVLPSVTEINYLDGVTSAIQTQINLRATLISPTFTGTVTIPTPFTLGATSVTTTGTQLNYINIATGVTGTGNMVFSDNPTFTTGLTTPTISVGDAVPFDDALYAQTEIFNIKDYGAVGDGVTDTHVAIESTFTAVNAVGGGIVVFPAGTYDLNSQVIVIPAKTVLKFTGGILIDGTLQGYGTTIDAPLIQIFNTNMVFTGTWLVNEVNPVWWGAIDDWDAADSTATDCTAAFCDAIQFFNRSLVKWSVNAIWGQGTVRVPKGVWLINGNLTSNNSNSWIGIKIIGESQYATTLVTTVDTAVMFDLDLYLSVEFSDMSFKHITATNRSTWTNVLFETTGTGGGNNFVLRRCNTYGFYRIISQLETDANEDTNVIEDCQFEACVEFLESANQEAYLNEINNCTWFGDIDYVLDINGFSNTVVRSANIVIKGTFLKFKDGSNNHRGSEFLLENCRWEFTEWDDNVIANTYPKILSAAGNSIFASVRLVNCGLYGGTVPHDSTIFMHVGAPLSIDVQGGRIHGRLKVTSNIYNLPVYNTGIVFDRVIFDHSPSTIMVYGTAASSYIWPNISYNQCTLGTTARITDINIGWTSGIYTGIPVMNPKRTMAISKNLAEGLIYQTTRGLTSLTQSFYGQRVVIEELKLYLSIVPTGDTCIVNVYTDAAKSINVAKDTIFTGDYVAPAYINIYNPTNIMTTDGLYFDIWQQTAKYLDGHFIVTYTSL